MPLLNQLTFHNWFSFSDLLTGGEPARNNQTSLWNMRDRLFLTLFERLSALYAFTVPAESRKVFENAVLAAALTPLFVLLYVHVNFIQTPVDCLAQISKEWPRDGLLRIELAFKQPHLHSYSMCQYDGLSIRTLSSIESTKTRLQMEPEKLYDNTNITQKLEFNVIVSDISTKKEVFCDFKDENLNPENYESAFDYLTSLRKSKLDFHFWPALFYENEYIIEYTLEYGYLKLSLDARKKLNLPILVVVLDPDDEKCFGNRISQFLLRYVVGYSDILMSSLKNLVDKDEIKGFVRNVVTGDQYRFVNKSLTWTSYGIAAITMVAFTLSISMLLRYSHHQIFMFIVQLLNVLEFNLNVSFPAASLLTVVFALVGMEAIMSEFFNDNTTAFYIILIVWVADQFDNICCHNIVTKRHWLRFFFLYHFAFYAYDHRFNGQYSNVALFTSWMFTLHSMVFFYHRYELPSIPLDMFEEDMTPQNFTWTFNFEPHRNFDEAGRNSFLVDASAQSDPSPPHDDIDTLSDAQSSQQDSTPCDSDIN